MNRKERRTVEKLMGKEAAQRAGLMTSMPEKCLTCQKNFDKKSREHAMTWYVEVFESQKRVDLYCPECQEKRKK